MIIYKLKHGKGIKSWHFLWTHFTHWLCFLKGAFQGLGLVKNDEQRLKNENLPSESYWVAAEFGNSR